MRSGCARESISGPRFVVSFIPADDNDIELHSLASRVRLPDTLDRVIGCYLGELTNRHRAIISRLGAD